MNLHLFAVKSSGNTVANIRVYPFSVYFESLCYSLKIQIDELNYFFRVFKMVVCSSRRTSATMFFLMAFKTSNLSFGSPILVIALSYLSEALFFQSLLGS